MFSAESKEKIAKKMINNYCYPNFEHDFTKITEINLLCKQLSI